MASQSSSHASRMGTIGELNASWINPLLSGRSIQSSAHEHWNPVITLIG